MAKMSFKGTTWSATGLDDGAEQFYAMIEYQAFTEYFLHREN